MIRPFERRTIESDAAGAAGTRRLFVFTGGRDCLYLRSPYLFAVLCIVLFNNARSRLCFAVAEKRPIYLSCAKPLARPCTRCTRHEIHPQTPIPYVRMTGYERMLSRRVAMSPISS